MLSQRGIRAGTLQSKIKRTMEKLNAYMDFFNNDDNDHHGECLRLHLRQY